MMKRSKQLLAVLLTMLMGTAAIADTGESTKEEKASGIEIVSWYTGSLCRVAFRKEVQGPVRVNFYDETGEKFFTDYINNRNQKTFIKNYDLKEVPYGKYKVEVKGKFGSATGTIHYEKATPDVFPVQKAYFKTTEDKKVNLTVLGEGLQPVKVNIYDTNNNLLKSDVIKSSAQFSRSYKLEMPSVKGVHFEVYSLDSLIATKKL